MTCPRQRPRVGDGCRRRNPAPSMHMLSVDHQKVIRSSKRTTCRSAVVLFIACALEGVQPSAAFVPSKSHRCIQHHQNKRHSKIQPTTRPSINAPTSSSSSALSMALVPIPASTLSDLLVTGLPTAAQYAAYWGRTSRERYQSMAESFNVTFLGVFGAYFLSFILGDFVALFAAFIAAFWVLLSPELKAYNRNWELRGGRDLVDPWLDDEVDFGGLREDQRGLYGAYYFGRVVRVAVVEDPTLPQSEEYPLEEFDDYTMETDENEKLMGIPWKLRLLVTDNNERELQVHARMSEEYLDIEEGMPVAAVILSTSRRFEQLAGLTDFCIPDAQCWVGDYPYLDRSSFESSIVRDGLWDTLLDEGTGDFANDEADMDYEGDYFFEDDDEFDEDWDYTSDQKGYTNDEEFDDDEYTSGRRYPVDDEEFGEADAEAFDDDSMREAMEMQEYGNKATKYDDSQPR